MRRAVILAALVTPLLAACGSSTTTGGTPSASPSTSATATSSVNPAATLPATPGGVACRWNKTADALTTVSLPPTTVSKEDRTATLVTTAGTIRIKLTASATPCTVASFVSLSMQGFYNGTTCHRMGNQPGLEFLQCGRPGILPSGNEAGAGYVFNDELTGKEIYSAGTVAMANSGPNTDGSQFFLVFGDCQFSPDYTVFGHMDAASIAVLKAIGAKGNDGSLGGGTGAPNEPVTFKSVTIN